MAQGTLRPLYHRYAWAFDSVVQDASTRRVRRLVPLIRALGFTGPLRVLDAGCGTGNYARALAQRGFRVVGVDSSGELLRCARAKVPHEGPRVRFIRADLRTYRPRRAFDVALCRGVLNDIVSERARDAVRRTLAEALVPGGMLVLDVRDWRRTVQRKRVEPTFERHSMTARGRLHFKSETQLDPRGRRMLLRETLRLAGPHRTTVVHNAFVMRCWAWGELRRRLQSVGFVRVRRLPPKALGLPSDRLVAIAVRGD
jgi:SAM-dependent methyltransferase